MTSTISIPGPGLPIDVRFGYAVYGDRHANPGSPSAPWYMVNDRKSASTLVATGETPIIMVGIYTEPEVAFMRITETDRGIGRATNLNAAGDRTVKRLILMTILLIGLVAAQVEAATYYVGTTGNDSNVGSSSAPWRTLQKAANTMVAGDTAIVKDGTYTQGALYFRTSGTSGSRITLRAENPLQAILATTAGCDESISLYASYVTIDGLRLTVSPSNVACTTGSTQGYHIHMWDSNEPVAGGNESSGYVGGWVKNVQIDASPQRYGGMKLRQDNALIENNVVHGELEAFNSNNAIIRNNTVYATINTVSNVIHTKAGSRNTQIYNNVVHMSGGNYMYGIVAGGCTGDQWFFDTTAKIEAYNAAIYNNIVLNDNGSNTNHAFAFWSSSNSKIFNNIAFNSRAVEYERSCASSGLQHPPPANPVFVNNILVDEVGGNSYGAGNVSDFTGTSVLNYNNFFGYTMPHSQTNPIIGNPLFVNPVSDWHLQAGSPAIGTGTVVTMSAYPSGATVVNQAKDGVTRPAGSAWDLGIYQTNGVAGDTNPPSTPVNLRVQ